MIKDEVFRKERNRLAAAKSRDKKKCLFDEMKEKIEELEAELKEQRQARSKLEIENHSLKKTIAELESQCKECTVDWLPSDADLHLISTTSSCADDSWIDSISQ